jgi:hypothetical protein
MARCKLGRAGTTLRRLLLHHDYCTAVVSEHSKTCFGLTRTEEKAPDNSEVQGHFRTVGLQCAQGVMSHFWRPEL